MLQDFFLHFLHSLQKVGRCMSVFWNPSTCSVLTWIIVLISSSDPRNVKRCRDGPDTETSRLLQRSLKYKEKDLDGANDLRRKLSQGEESSLSGFDCWGQALAMARENVIERALSGRTIGGSGWVWPNSRFEGKNWRFSTAAPACSWCVHIHNMWAPD